MWERSALGRTDHPAVNIEGGRGQCCRAVVCVARSGGRLLAVPDLVASEVARRAGGWGSWSPLLPLSFSITVFEKRLLESA